MSYANYNLKLSELLTSLAQAIQDRQGDDVLALLRVLRMSGLKDDISAELVATFTEIPQDSDFALAQKWLEEQLPLPTDFPSFQEELTSEHAPRPQQDWDPMPEFELEEVDPFDNLELIDISPTSDEFEDLEAFLSIADDEELLIDGSQDIFDDFDDFDEEFFSFADELSDHSFTPDNLSDAGESEAPTKPAFPSHLIASPDRLPRSPHTEDRDLTRQFHPDHLQTLSEASIGAKSSDAQDNLHERPTEARFQLTEEELFDRPLSTPQHQADDESLDLDFEFDAWSPPEDENTDFDFDFGPSVSQRQDDEETNDQEEDDDDFDFDFGFTAGQEETQPGADPLAAEMGYVEPEDDFFFPPPLNAPKEEAPQEKPPTRSSTAPGLFGAATKQDQKRSLFQPSPFDSLDFAQEATPPRGSTPLPAELLAAATEEFPSPHTRVLSPDELLSLGEELTLSGNTSPRYSEPTTPPPEPQRYRGEPLIRNLGDEPTPAKDLSESGTPIPFQSASKSQVETNPFAQQVPTGVRDRTFDPASSASFLLEEVRPPSPAHPQDDPLKIARRHYEQAEFQEALEILETLLKSDEDNEAALSLRAQLEGELIRIEENKIGALTGTPRLAIDMTKLATLDLDHRAGFLLSQIDGSLTFEDILDMSAMARLETLTLLASLLEQEIIAAD